MEDTPLYPQDPAPVAAPFAGDSPQDEPVSRETPLREAPAPETPDPADSDLRRNAPAFYDLRGGGPASDAGADPQAPVIPEPLGVDPTDSDPAPAPGLGSEPSPGSDVSNQWNPVPPPAPEVQKKSPVKLIAAALAGLVVLGGLGFGAWKLVSRKKGPDNKVLAAAQNSGEKLKDYLGQLPNLGKVMDNLEQVAEKKEAQGGMHLEGALGGDTISVDMEMIAGLEAQRVDLDLTIPGATGSLTASLYAAQDGFQLYSRELLGEDYLLTMGTQDFGKRWNESALGQMMDLELPEDFQLNLTTQSDPETYLVDAFGEDWTRFSASVQVIPLEGTSHFTQSGDTYTITWDSETLDAMYQVAAQHQTRPGHYDLDPNSLLSEGFTNTYSYMVVDLLHQLDQQEIKGQFLIQKDLLLGIYVETADDSTFELLLEGEKNPWEKLRITEGFTHKNQEDQTIRTEDVYDADLSVEGNQLTVLVNHSHTDQDHDSYDYQEGPVMVLYDDADGAVTAVDETGTDLMDGEKLWLRPDGDQTVVEASIPGEEGVSLRFRMGPLTDKAQPLTGEAHDLLDMSQQKLQGLVMKLMLRLQKLFPNGGGFLN